MKGPLEAAPTLLTLAMGRAPRLWLVPLSAVAAYLVLLRKRSPRAMRGARLALLIIALAPSITVGLSLRNLSEMLTHLSRPWGQTGTLEIGSGAWLVWLAALPFVWGSLRLGVVPPSSRS